MRKQLLHSNQIINESNGIESIRCIYNRKVICIKYHYGGTKRNFLLAKNDSDHKWVNTRKEDPQNKRIDYRRAFEIWCGNAVFGAIIKKMANIYSITA